MEKLNIVVVGTGMYVCGRGTQGYGTIMPAICQWSREGHVGKVYVAGRSRKNTGEAARKIRQVQRRMGTDLKVAFIPSRGDDPKAYMKAIAQVPRPAALIVAVPDALHKEVAAAAIRSGLHVLVVKPLVPTVGEAIQLIRLQDKHKVYCSVEFHKRYDQANIKMKDAISEGLIGDPLYFVAEFSQRKSIPAKAFKSWAASTNVFQYLGVHYADIIYFATGAVPLRVSATGQKYWLRSKGVDTYDSIEATTEWRMPSGKKFISCILTNWIDPESTSAMSDQKIKVIGTKGRFESDQKRRGVMLVRDGEGIEEPNPYFSSPSGSFGEISYSGYGIESIAAFLKDSAAVSWGQATVSDLEAKRPTFRQSIISTAIVEAVKRSLSGNGRWIDMKGIGTLI